MLEALFTLLAFGLACAALSGLSLALGLFLFLRECKEKR